MKTRELFKSLNLKPPFPISRRIRKNARAVASKSYWDGFEKRAMCPKSIAAFRKFVRSF